MAKAFSPFVSIPVSPVTGSMDDVSPPDLVPIGQWRLVQNFSANEQQKLCRAFGWTRLLPRTINFNNTDLHDQYSVDISVGAEVISQNLQLYFDDLTPPNEAANAQTEYPPYADNFGQYCDTTQKKRTNTAREFITLLQQVTSTEGSRTLIAATQTRLYALNQARGSWKILWDGFGGDPKENTSGPRLVAATVGDATILTNNYDEPVVWYFDQPTFGCAMKAVSPIPSLAVIGLTKAAVVASFKGFVILGNVELDNVRYENMLVWSDFDSVDFDPATPGTFAGRQSLGYGEKILGMAQTGGQMAVYTTQSIWLITTVEDQNGRTNFNIQPAYTGGVERENCLIYKNTLTPVGDTHYYLGIDAIYRWNPLMARPERTEWIHRACGDLFGNINPNVCEAPVMAYHATTKELVVSWPQIGHVVNNQSKAFNLFYQHPRNIDAGFTALGNFTADDRGTIEDFLLESCGCHSDADIQEALAELGVPLSVKEGVACISEDPTCDEDSVNWPIYTTQPLLVPGTDFYTEDYTKAEADEDSFCTLLDGESIEDLCDECDTTIVLVMASAVDKALKQLGGGYFRERFIGVGLAPSLLADFTTKCGNVYASYSMDGYRSLLRSGALGFGTDKEKTIRRLIVEYIAELQAQPSMLRCRVGTSAQSVDPNDPKCVIMWKELEAKPLKCLSTETEREYREKGLRPGFVCNFEAFETGNYIYVELFIEGRGGGVCLSKVTLEVSKVQN